MQRLNAKGAKPQRKNSNNGAFLGGLASLAFVSFFIPSPYAAGLMALVLASIVNYFALKHVVFTERGMQ